MLDICITCGSLFPAVMVKGNHGVRAQPTCFWPGLHRISSKSTEHGGPLVFFLCCWKQGCWGAWGPASPTWVQLLLHLWSHVKLEVVYFLFYWSIKLHVGWQCSTRRDCREFACSLVGLSRCHFISLENVSGNGVWEETSNSCLALRSCDRARKYRAHYVHSASQWELVLIHYQWRSWKKDESHEKRMRMENRERKMPRDHPISVLSFFPH